MQGRRLVFLLIHFKNLRFPIQFRHLQLPLAEEEPDRPLQNPLHAHF
jgi:hypothetical protein